MAPTYKKKKSNAGHKGITSVFFNKCQIIIKFMDGYDKIVKIDLILLWHI